MTIQKVKKIILLVLVTAGFSLVGAGCDRKPQEQPAAEQPAAEHPKSEHPK